MKSKLWASAVYTLSRRSPFATTLSEAIGIDVDVCLRDDDLVHTRPTIHSAAQVTLDPERRFTESSGRFFHINRTASTPCVSVSVRENGVELLRGIVNLTPRLYRASPERVRGGKMNRLVVPG